jgi:hypothetical protein
MAGGAAVSGPSWLVTATLIGAWYASNIGVLLLNKYLLTSTGFDNPVFLTACHMTACVVVGLMVSATGVMAVASIKSRKQLTKVVVLAAIFCGTIVLGNASLKYIPVSFNQAIGGLGATFLHRRTSAIHPATATLRSTLGGPNEDCAPKRAPRCWVTHVMLQARASSASVPGTCIC